MHHHRCWQSYNISLHSGVRLLIVILALITLVPLVALAEVHIDPREIVTLLPKDARKQ
jgi:hypothetical protein